MGTRERHDSRGASVRRGERLVKHPKGTNEKKGEEETIDS